MATEYDVQGPPGSLVPFSATFGWNAARIDYARHPAYAELKGGAGLAMQVATLVGYSRSFVSLLTKRAIQYELVPHQYRSPRGAGDRLGFIGNGLRNMFRFLRPARPLPQQSVCGRELAANGISAVVIPDVRFAALDAASKPHFDALAARRGRKVNRREFDESRASADRRDDPALYTLIESILDEAGVSDAANRYLGRKAKLVDVNPQINDPSDTFWLDIFPDREGEPIPDAAYFHCDASGGDLKAIIYMTDVGPDNGPFTYAIGSNHLRVGKVDDLLREANDHNGLSGTDPEARRKFAALPRFLQRKWSFGNDLDNASPLSEAIRKAAWDVTAPKGSIVLFDTKGIHRGGMVEKGERRVITCVLG